MRSNSSKTLLIGILGLFGLVILGLAAYIAYLQWLPISDDVPDYLLDDDGITEITPPLPLPDFSLMNQAGDTQSLDTLSGELTLVTFGFTHCPDICPITLGDMRNIHENLGAQADEVNFVFISVDGRRDTSQVLQTYFQTLRVADFMIGLTGNDAETAIIREPLGVEVILQEPDQFGNYNVDHTAGMFLLDADQDWIRRYRYGTRSDLIADDIARALN